VVRKDLGKSHSKLVTLIGDYGSLSSLKDQIKADDVFITLGTTQKKTPNPIEYYQVDHDYPVSSARIALDNGATSVFVVTAVGANTSSKIPYVRTKGETERDILALGYAYTHIFRPSFIMGKRAESRPMERAMMAVWRFINPIFLGKLNRFKGINAKDIAQAMNNSAKINIKNGNKENDKTQWMKIYQWKEMKELLR